MEQVRRAEFRSECLGKEIRCECLAFPSGIQLALFGGDRPHIGAAGIADPEGNIRVTQFSGHKEGILCQEWLEALRGHGMCPAVLEAGIHYDGLTKEGIETVMQCARGLLESVIHEFSPEA